jgi:hypothetical protein
MKNVSYKGQENAVQHSLAFLFEKFISIRQKRTKSSKGFLDIHREFLSMMPFYVVGGDSVDQRNSYALSRPDP